MDKKRLKTLKQQAGNQGHNGLEMQQELTKIYQTQDGSMPDISHLEVQRRSRWKVIAFVLLGGGALLASVSWLGFLMLGGSDRFNTSSIKLEIDAPQNIASGDEVQYRLTYKNVEPVPLDDVEIIFRYPDGFTFTESSPAPQNSDAPHVWTLGRLERNQSGEIVIKGTLIGEVGSLKTINATASFRPENFSSLFKETAEATSQITTSILEITVEGPPKTLVEKEVRYLITYRNASRQKLEHLKVVANYPPSFVFKGANPEPYTRKDEARHFNNQWVIDSLAPNQEGEIEITGGYLADPEQTTVDFTVQIGFLDPQTNEFSVQQEKTAATSITGQNLALNLIANGSNQDQPISFDQTLAYSIVYKNLGTEDLDDVTISATLDGDVLDWSSLDDRHGGTVEGSTITWTKEQLAEFDLLRPLDEGSIDFTIQVKASDDINLNETNLQVTSRAEATASKIGDLDAADARVASNEIKSTINTDVDLKVEGRYFTDDNIPVGSGPLPPVVGQTTTFRVYWSIQNSLHEVGDVTVSATLPQGVSWANKFLVKTGSLRYDAGGRTVTWTIPSINPNEGFEDISAWFDVSVTPTKDQARRLLILTGQASLTATDEVTGAAISKVSGAVTSNLDDDPIGGGKGLVVEIAE